MASVLTGLMTPRAGAALAAGPGPQPPPGSPSLWVSYLSGFTQLPFEGSMGGKVGPAGCEWHLYNPAMMQDLLFLKLPAPPQEVTWDRQFQRVWYKSAGNLYSADWRAGSIPRIQHARTPGNTAGAAGGPRRPGRGTRGVYVSIDRLLGAMTWEGMGARRPKGVSHLEADSSGNAGVFFPSSSSPGRGLSLKLEIGDTRHVVAPILYVDRRTHSQRVIYERGSRCGDGFDQLAFREAGGYLLMGAEYTGNCSRLVDMRTGETLMRFPANSSAAVWVAPLN